MFIMETVDTRFITGKTWLDDLENEWLFESGYIESLSIMILKINIWKNLDPCIIWPNVKFSFSKIENLKTIDSSHLTPIWVVEASFFQTESSSSMLFNFDRQLRLVFISFDLIFPELHTKSIQSIEW